MNGIPPFPPIVLVLVVAVVLALLARKATEHEGRRRARLGDALDFTLTASIVEDLAHFAGESRRRIRFGQEFGCCLKDSIA